MQRFVAERNTSRFVDQYQIAHDRYIPDRRFKSSCSRCIRESKARIGEHERLIQKKRANGHSNRDFRARAQ
jgi:hypothetical protein